MNQWYGELLRAFGPPVLTQPAAAIGLIGGGYYDFQPLTVTTYDSAYIHLERWGNRSACSSSTNAIICRARATSSPPSAPSRRIASA